MNKIASKYKNFIKFITHDIWRVGSEKLNKRDAFLIRQLKIFIIAVRSFNEDKISMRASALTFYTIMSIIPVAALVFAIAKGFNFEPELRAYLFKEYPDQQDIVQWCLNFVDSTLKNTKNGLIAGIGIFILLWSYMKLIVHIEEAFNHVWNVKNPRTWTSRFSNYFAMMIIAPIFLILSISVSLTVNHHIDGVLSTYSFFQGISPFLTILYKCVPFLASWILLSLLYKFMPNTRVKYTHALLAGIIAGTLFQLMQNLYVYSQVSITRFSAIYGTFAAIPLFLIWAQMSWLIVLLGAELSFAYQNIDHYESEKESENTSFRQRKIIALLVTRLIAINFKNGELPLEVPEIAERLSLPVRIVRVVVDDLVAAEILSEIVSDEKEYAYQPRFDVNKMTVSIVLSRLEKIGRSDLIMNNDASDYIIELIDKSEKDFEKSNNNKLIVEM